MFTPRPDGPALVIGSAGLDLVGRALGDLQPATSNPGQLRMSPGGVARNVAENLARLGQDVVLLTAVGDDAEGRALLQETAGCGVDVGRARLIADAPTGAYLAILDTDGGLHIGMDDMRVIETIDPDFLNQQKELFKQASLVFVDANLPPRTLQTAVSLAWRSGTPIAADPTSVALAPRLSQFLKRLWLIAPNEAEAEALCPHPVPHADRERVIEAARHLVSEGVELAVITMAEFGVGYATAESSGHIPAMRTEIVDPTGAGDALAAALIYALLNEIPLDEAVRLGVSAAALTLRSPGTVAPDLSLERLYEELR